MLIQSEATMNCDDKTAPCQPCPQGGSNSDCEIQCGHVDSCAGKTLDCSGSGRCQVHCLKAGSCKGASIKCPIATQLKPGVTSGCIINCVGGQESCRDADVSNPVDDAVLNCESSAKCHPYIENCRNIQVNGVVQQPPIPNSMDCTITWITLGMKISSPSWVELLSDRTTVMNQLRSSMKNALVSVGRTDTQVKLTFVCPLLPGGIKPTSSDSLVKQCIDPNQQFTTLRSFSPLGVDDGLYAEVMLQGPAHYTDADKNTIEDSLRDASMNKGPLVNSGGDPQLISVEPISYINGEYSLETQSQEADGVWSKARASDWSEPTPPSDPNDILPIILIAVGGCLLLMLMAVLVVIRGKSRRQNADVGVGQDMKMSEFLGSKNRNCLESMEEAECVLTDYYRQNRGRGGRDPGEAAPMAAARVPGGRSPQTGSVSRSSSESSDGQNRLSPTGGTGGNTVFTRPSGRGSSTRTVMSPPQRSRAFAQSTRRF